MRPDTPIPPESGVPAAEVAFEIAGRRIYPQCNEAVVAGERRRLEARHMKVLLRLADEAGEAVAREDLLDAGWGGRAVGDDSLTQAISRLRRALDDGRGETGLIETLPKIGYRLTCAPRPLAPSRIAVRAMTTRVQRARAAMTLTRAQARAAFLLGAVLFLGAGAFAWRASGGARGMESAAGAEAPREAPGAPERRVILYRTLQGPEQAPPPGPFKPIPL